MNILVVDSSKKQAYVGVITDSKSFGYTLQQQEKHSENLLMRIEEVVVRADLNLNDFDVYSAVVGPGSFTGIRVGLSTIKAFNIVNNKKLVALNSFEPFLQVCKYGVILLNSTHTSYYYALVKAGEIEEMGTVCVDDLSKLVKDKDVYMLDYEKNENLGDIKVNFVDNYGELLKQTVVEKCNNSEFVNDNEFEPVYLQLSQAEIQLNNKK